MSAIFIRAHGMTQDDKFVICARSLVFFDLDTTLAPHVPCGDTTKV